MRQPWLPDSFDILGGFQRGGNCRLTISQRIVRQSNFQGLRRGVKPRLEITLSERYSHRFPNHNTSTREELPSQYEEAVAFTVQHDQHPNAPRPGASSGDVSLESSPYQRLIAAMGRNGFAQHIPEFSCLLEMASQQHGKCA